MRKVTGSENDKHTWLIVTLSIAKSLQINHQPESSHAWRNFEKFKKASLPFRFADRCIPLNVLTTVLPMYKQNNSPSRAQWCGKVKHS